MNVDEVVKIIEKYFSIDIKESWDNIGLLVAGTNKQVSKILMCVNASKKNIDYAKKINADFIFTHHPISIKGIKKITNKSAIGSKIITLIKNDIVLYSAHTNADMLKHGVSDSFMELLGIKNSKIIEEIDINKGLGRFGLFIKEITLSELIKRIEKIVPKSTQGILISSENMEQKIKKVAFCGGSGDSLLDKVALLNADVYVTADLRFHPADTFISNNKTVLINLNHSASEYIWLELFAKKLKNELKNIEIVLNKNIDEPWRIRI
jgi:dinuclear metal center YbgI/SA1388 family protein